MPEDVFAAATSFAQSAFDQLSELNDNPGFIEGYSENLDGPHNYLSLDL